MSPPRVLVLPGWQGSGPGHWQTLWEERHGYTRVEQHEWMRPLRGDWLARLEEAVLASDAPVVFAAHSLGCILVAAWSARSRSTQRVKGALLVAPGDAERPELREQLPTWSPIELQPLRFPGVLVASRNDPYCDFERARLFAHAWGLRFVDHGESGHINADSGLGDWPQGHALLQELTKD